jgi:hypothetical protein
VLTAIEVCVSYTSTAREVVREIVPHLEGVCRMYVYEDYLDRQAGLYVSDIGVALYGSLPCIIFATEDWYKREATIFELRCMKTNPCRKLLFDYCGNFGFTGAAQDLRNIDLGTFDERGNVSISGIRGWLLNLA